MQHIKLKIKYINFNKCINTFNLINNYVFPNVKNTVNESTLKWSHSRQPRGNALRVLFLKPLEW